MASRKRRRKPKAPDAPPALSSYERFVMEEHRRSEIKGAPYNPRVISDKAKAKLRKILKQHGLVMPLVWNRRTGNLIAGHQRLIILDSLEGKPDYLLTVAVVDVDETEEKELNVALNNELAMGEWDMTKLEDIFKGGAEPERLGFDIGEVMQLFGDRPEILPTKALLEAAENLRQHHERWKKVAEQMQGRDSPDFYLVCVFRDYRERKAFTDRLGLEDNKFIAAPALVAAVLAAAQAAPEAPPRPTRNPSRPRRRGPAISHKKS